MLIGYYFTVGNIHIDHTRSLGDDTDYVMASVTVGDRSFPKKFISMGDVDNGDYNVGPFIGPVPIEDTGVKVSFNYQVVNSGNKDPSAIQKALSDAADQLAKKLFEEALKRLESGDLWTALGAGAGAGVIKLIKGVFTTDCDGLEALDQLSLTGAQLRTKTKTGWSETRSYPGTDSPRLCGSNSDYKVSFSVSRGPWSGWLPLPGVETDLAQPLHFSRVDITFL